MPATHATSSVAVATRCRHLVRGPRLTASIATSTTAPVLSLRSAAVRSSRLARGTRDPPRDARAVRSPAPHGDGVPRNCSRAHRTARELELGPQHPSGVRSSCPASATKARWRWSASWSAASKRFMVVANACNLVMCRREPAGEPDSSCSEISAAVRRMRSTGRNAARPVPTHRCRRRPPRCPAEQHRVAHSVDGGIRRLRATLPTNDPSRAPRYRGFANTRYGSRSVTHVTSANCSAPPAPGGSRRRRRRGRLPCLGCREARRRSGRALARRRRVREHLRVERSHSATGSGRAPTSRRPADCAAPAREMSASRR